MGSEIEIRCADRFERGEKMQVEIFVNFNRPTRVRNIRAVFIGRERTQATYTETETDSKGKSKSVTKTATEYVEIVNESFLLMGEPPKGFFANLNDAMSTLFGGGSAETIEPGQQKFTIDVMVPGGAPPSLMGEKCQVTYEVQVVVDIPVKFDWNHTKSIHVRRLPINFADTQPVHVVYPDANGPSFWDQTFGKDVTLNLAVDRNKICVGETALAMLTIDSPSPFNVSQIKCSLVGHESTRARSHTDSWLHSVPIGLIDSPNILSGESAHEFEILVSDFEAPYSQDGTNFSVKWSVEVRIDVPWAKDPIIQAPIEVHPPNVDVPMAKLRASKGKFD